MKKVQLSLFDVPSEEGSPMPSKGPKADLHVRNGTVRSSMSPFNHTQQTIGDLCELCSKGVVFNI